VKQLSDAPFRVNLGLANKHLTRLERPARDKFSGKAGAYLRVELL
jgi:hypothetical protein